MNRKIIAIYWYGTLRTLKDFVFEMADILIEEKVPSVKVFCSTIPFRIFTPNVEIVFYNQTEDGSHLKGRTFDEMFSFPSYMKQHIRLSKETTNWQGSIIDYVKTMEGIL